jgi:hypothetical protein
MCVCMGGVYMLIPAWFVVFLACPFHHNSLDISHSVCHCSGRVSWTIGLWVITVCLQNHRIVFMCAFLPEGRLLCGIPHADISVKLLLTP